MPLWLADKPLVLASKSAVRRLVIESAGIPVDVCPADIDGNGVVNSTDVSAFINMWFEDQTGALLNADFNRDGVSNSTDVSDMINAYFEAGLGCG